MVDAQGSSTPRRRPIREGLLSDNLSDLDQVSLVGSRCDQCGETSLGRHKSCPNCGGRDLKPVPLGREGALWTYTVVRNRPPGDYKGPDPFVPFGLGLVELSEGIRVMAPLAVEPDALEIDQKLIFRAYVLYRDEAGDDVVAFDFTSAPGKN